jgi:hypothetical protein
LYPDHTVCTLHEKQTVAQGLLLVRLPINKLLLTFIRLHP